LLRRVTKYKPTMVALTREELKKELQAFSDECMYSLLLEFRDLVRQDVRQELQQFVQNLSLSQVRDGGSDSLGSTGVQAHVLPHVQDAPAACELRDYNKGVRIRHHGCATYMEMMATNLKGSQGQEHEGYKQITVQDLDPLPPGPSLGSVGLLRRNTESLHTWTHTLTMKRIIHTPLFARCIAFCVVLNCVALGMEADSSVRRVQDEKYTIAKTSEPVFCCIFVVEIVLRLSVYGKDFFVCGKWKWNVFDLLLVVLQVIEHIVQQFKYRPLPPFMGFIRMIRITRLMRVGHLFDELGVLGHSLFTSTGSLMWTMVLLVAMIYFYSVLLLETIARVPSKHDDTSDDLQYYFGTLERAVLTMFECVAGGVSWDSVVVPLIQDVSPVVGFVFCSYVALALFAVLNLVAGILVDRAMEHTRECKDAIMAKRITKLFTRPTEAGITQDVTLDSFVDHMNDPIMKDFFKVLNIHTSDAHRIFELMATDSSDSNGRVSSYDMINGCLRLAGHARAVDLAIMEHELSWMHKHICNIDLKINGLLNPNSDTLRRRATLRCQNVC